MSSGIPNLPKKQLRPAAADSDDEEDTPIAEVEAGAEEVEAEDSDAESGVPGSDASGIDDDSSASSVTSGGVSGDDDDDEEGGEGADSSGDEGDGAGGAGGGGAAAEDDDNPSKKNKKKRLASTRKKNMEDDMTLLGVPHGIQFDDDESDDEDDERDNDSAEYFQKLKTSVRESYVNVYHPESMSHNYDEIQTLARVVRDSAGVIVDDLHRTIPIMTKYEKTRILGQRAKQINEGAPAFIKIDSTVIDGYLIAVKELEQKKTPFIIRRPLPNGGSEYWRVQDLEIL
jgi:DNA-directed RNA polymerase I, II, and III subunit RPABC2